MRLRLALVFTLLASPALAQHVGDVYTYGGPTLGAIWSPPSALSISIPNGGLLYSNNGSIAGYTVGASFTTIGGIFDLGDGLVSGLKLASNAACFNLGPWTGDLFGSGCSSPVLSVGAAARNLGNVAGDLTGSWPTLTLKTSAVVGALGPPAGDLGGSSFVAPLVMGLRGIPLDTSVPTPGQGFFYDGAQWKLQLSAPGINQLVGDVTTPVGVGQQPATISNGAVTNAKLAAQAAQTIKCNSGATGTGATADCPITSTLSLGASGLGLAPSGVVAQQVAFGSFCVGVNTFGQVTSIASGTCSTGTGLTADDGTTQLTADDGTTVLVADGGGSVVTCPALAAKGNLACNSAIVAIP